MSTKIHPETDPKLLGVELKKIEKLGVQRYLNLAFATDKTHIDEYLDAHIDEDEDDEDEDELRPLPARPVECAPPITEKSLPRLPSGIYESNLSTPQPPALSPRSGLSRPDSAPATISTQSRIPKTLESRLSALKTFVSPYASEVSRSASTAAAKSARWSKKAWGDTRTWAAPKATGAEQWSKQAWGDTRFWAGGLLSRPTESTRSFTIMRHSPGLIYYRGHGTSVSLTIFSKHRYGSNRTLWLQQRGFSGDKELLSEYAEERMDTWVDVTPAAEAQLNVVSEADRRGWERDLAKFEDESKDDERLSGHEPRETMIVRIPATVKDGYFRFVLCTRRKGADGTGKCSVLCPGPVFRLASTSSDPSKIRGASKTTMPVEIGLKAGSMAAKIAIGVATSQISPITMVAANAAGATPGPTTMTQYGGMALGAAGNFVAKKAITRKFRSMANFEHTIANPKRIEDNDDVESPNGTKKMRRWFDDVKESANGGFIAGTQTNEDQEISGTQFDLAKHDLFGGTNEGNEAPSDVVSSDDGPVKPFPHIFKGKVVRGTGRKTGDLGLETANLARVPGWITGHMYGVYFGWTSIDPSKRSERASCSSKLSTEWFESIISIGPSPYTGPTIAAKSEVTVHIIHDFERPFFDTRLKVIVMGFLRQETYGACLAREKPREKSLVRLVEHVTNDVEATISSLNRASWGADETLQRLEQRKADRKWKDKYVDTKTTVQKRVDSMPLHLAGVRTAGAQRRDAVHGNGGLWIRR